MIKEYSDSDNDYLQIIKKRAYKEDKEEVKLLMIEKLEAKINILEEDNKKYKSKIEELKNEIDSINEGFNMLIEKLLKKN